MNTSTYDALGAAADHAHRDPERKNLHQALLRWDGEVLTVSATDGHALCRVQLPSNWGGSASVTLALPTIRQLVDVAEENKGHIELSPHPDGVGCNGTVYPGTQWVAPPIEQVCCRFRPRWDGTRFVYDGSAGEYEFMEFSWSRVAAVSACNIVRDKTRVTKLKRERPESVVVALANGLATLRGDSGRTAQILTHGGAVEARFAVNREYLARALRWAPGDRVTVAAEVPESNGAARLFVTSENYTAVVIQMRL